MSFDIGRLVPAFVMDCIPGDNIRITPEMMLRFSPLVAPVMHRVDVYSHFFFVPYRILWSAFEDFIANPDSDIVAPFVSMLVGDNFPVGSIGDYLGFPTGAIGAVNKVSPMSIAAYLKIYDEWYRDQNLQLEKFTPLVPGDNASDYENYFDTLAPLRRAWMHDYFTSALPFAQKGDAVQIPLTTQDNIPVDFTPGTGKATFARDPVTGDIITDAGNLENQVGPSPFSYTVQVEGAPTGVDNSDFLSVDVQADATDINTLRKAFSIQAWLERNARGGTRYVENILAHFGVKSSDARLQRPELVGTARQNMVISEVLATAQSTDDGVAVGTMAGHGISVGGGNRMRYRCEEHGIFMVIINVQPVTAYQQGIHRQFTRFDRLDYAWPGLANLGEQEVRQKEVYAGTLTPELVFGYNPRYSEYKYMNSRVAGEFRTSLAFWHLGRIFQTDPALNEEFIECNPRTDIFAVTDPEEDHIWAHTFNNISVVRKLPRYGVPSTL